MTDSMESIIERQRMSARMQVLSAELGSVGVGKSQREHQEKEYWEEEIRLGLLGYKTGIDFLRKHSSILEDSSLNQSKQAEPISLTDCQLEESELRRIESGQVSDIHRQDLQKPWPKTHRVLMAFYLCAELLFEAKNFSDSYNLFCFLTLVNQDVPSFWVGRGSASESMQHWDRALNEYWVAESFKTEDPIIYEALLRIYHHLKDQEQLDYCLGLIKQSPKLRKQVLQSPSAKEAS